jgi:hypothetical protein
MIQSITISTVAILAAAGQQGPSVDGAWVTGFVVAVLGAVGTLLGYQKGRKTKTEVEPNPLPVAMVSELATKDELTALEARLVGEIKKLETALVGERGVARTANGNLHARIDKTSEGLAAVQATTTQINANLNRLMDLLMTGVVKPNHPRNKP